MKCDELEKKRYAPAILQNGAGQCIAVMSENSEGMWLHYGVVMEVIEELKNVVGGVLNMRMNGLTINDLFRNVWCARAMRASCEKSWIMYLKYVHDHPNSFYEFDGDDIISRDNKNFDGFRLWVSRWEKVERKCSECADKYKILGI